MTSLVRRWAPLVLLTGVMLRMTLAACLPLSDPDTWWHLRLGDEFRDGWSLTEPGQLSSFATVQWVPTQWLPEVVASWTEDRWGPAGVAWLFGLGLVLVVLAVYVACRWFSDALPAVVATGLALGAATASLSPRPQILSFGFLALTVGIWMRTAASGRTPWVLVPLSWVWAMCHGMWFTGALVGVGVVVGMALDRDVAPRSLARAAAVPVLSVAAAALTPAGPRLLLAPFAVGERRTLITEWQPPTWTEGQPWVVVAMLLTVAVLAVRRRPSWVELALVAMSVVWLVTSARTVALAGVILAPLLAARIQDLLPGRTRVTRVERVWVSLSVVACLTLLTVVAPRTADRPVGVPLALDDQLAALPAGTSVLNSWVLGGWLEWRHPDLEPVVDGLAEAYPVDHLRGYVDMLALEPGWEDYVAGTGVDAALLTADHRPLADALREDLGWRQVGEDDGTVLLAAP